MDPCMVLDQYMYIVIINTVGKF